MNPQKPKTKMKMRSAKKYKERYRMSCLIGYRISKRIWLMKVLQQILGETQTKITSASCRRRTGTVMLRAEIFGDLITADHKVLSEESESRNNHRHAVVVRDLATQWLQSYPCKTKSSQETKKNLMRFLEPTRKIKSHLASLARNYPGIIVRQHHTDQKQI